MDRVEGVRRCPALQSDRGVAIATFEVSTFPPGAMSATRLSPSADL